MVVYAIFCIFNAILCTVIGSGVSSALIRFPCCTALDRFVVMCIPSFTDLNSRVFLSVTTYHKRSARLCAVTPAMYCGDLFILRLRQLKAFVFRIFGRSCPVEFHYLRHWFGWTFRTMAVCLRNGILAKNGQAAISRLATRLSHTDVIKEIPDFDSYRRKATLDPTMPSDATDAMRKAGTYSTYAIGGVIALYCAKKAAKTLVLYKGPPATMYAMEVTSVNLAQIAEGKSSTVLWQGKPVFVKHRTQQEIDKERAVDLKILRDPQPDTDRAKRPEWLIVIATCTHLGCVPIAGKGNYGGYYCPCHGSHYDGSGRVRQGPAPLNLELPPYHFPDDNTLVIGKDT